MINHLYDTTCIIKRPTMSKDANEELVKTLADLKTIDCRIRQLSGKEFFEYNKIGYNQVYRVYIDITDVTVKDVLYINSAEYEIINIHDVYNNFYQVDVSCIK